MLKSHCQGDFAKAGIYPFDLRRVSKEKLLSLPLSVNSQNNQASFSITRSDSNDTLFHRNQHAEVCRVTNCSLSCISLSTNGEPHIIKLKREFTRKSNIFQ